MLKNLSFKQMKLKSFFKTINFSKKTTPQKFFSANDYYFGFHKENSINKEIYNSSGSYYHREKNLAIALETGQLKDSYFNFEYDFFNSNIQCHSLFAKTYRNQVLALCLNRSLLNDEYTKKLFIPEAIEKFKKYDYIKIGAYTCAKGYEKVRMNIAKYISERDNFETDPEDIYCTYGGIDAYHHTLGLIFNKGDEIIMPSPCYPVYLGYNKACHLKNMFYHFNQNKIDLEDLHYKLNNQYNGCESKAKRPKAMVVINPNNPTGQILSKEEIQKIIVFCVDNNLVLIASEVLQNLVHEGKFTSFRSVLKTMPHPYNKLELFSTHSASKANLFNSGARAGFLNVMNLNSQVKVQLYKHASIDICSATSGQIMMDLTFTPPTMEEGIFGQDFVDRYNNSINISKDKNKKIVENVADSLRKSKLFSFVQPQAGFTFFINLSVKEIQKNGQTNILMGEKPLCDLYAKNLFKETKILCTPGNGKI